MPTLFSLKHFLNKSFHFKTLEVKTYRLDGTEDPTLRGSTPYPTDLSAPENIITVCQQRRDSSVACRLLLTAQDHTLALLQHPGGFLWTRHEALASILGVEIVDLPVSDTDAAIEKEFGDKAGKFLDWFRVRRINQIGYSINGVFILIAADLGFSSKWRV